MSLQKLSLISLHACEFVSCAKKARETNTLHPKITSEIVAAAIDTCKNALIVSAKADVDVDATVKVCKSHLDDVRVSRHVLIGFRSKSAQPLSNSMLLFRDAASWMPTSKSR